VSGRAGSGRTGRGGPSRKPQPADRRGGPGAARQGGGRQSARAPGRPGGGGPPARSRERGLGGSQVEGRQAVRELLLGGQRKVREIVLSTEVDRSDIISDILDLAAELRVPVTEVGRSKLDSLSHTEAPQGIIARAGELPESSLEDLCNPGGGVVPFLLAVDGVTDPGNLGALLRIGECAGVTGVVLPRHRAVHVTPTVTKAAAGAIEYLPMTLVGGLPTAIESMKAAGVWVVGLDAGGETSIHDLDLTGSGVCLVLGAEGKGLSRLVRQRCDLIASIPLHGRLASLNVASAGAVACYEIARRRAV
jgi:23S rRNA (guanosine2251-2'-O)-methyltransferase